MMLRIACLFVTFFVTSHAGDYEHQRHGDYDNFNDNYAKILSYENENSGTGQYRFSFSTSDGIQRLEEGDLSNPNTENEVLVVRGAYSYTGPDGVVYTVRYTADENGFHPEGDHIKVPPFTPWDKHQQQQEDESGYYTQANFARKPVASVYLPGAQKPAFSNQQPIYGSSNTPKPAIAKYSSSNHRVFRSKTAKPVLAPVISTTSRPMSFSSLSEVAYAPTRRTAGSNEENSNYQTSSLANILEILSSEKVEDNAAVKVEDINSL